MYPAEDGQYVGFRPTSKNKMSVNYVIREDEWTADNGMPELNQNQ